MKARSTRTLIVPALLAAAAPLAICPSVAQAQTAGGDSARSASTNEGASELDAIIVTARKRAENIQSVPVAITAINAETLRSKTISSPYDLLSVAPGLSLTAGTGTRNDPQYFIRGQGATYGAQPSVVQYFADVPVPEYSLSVGQNITLFDLESVQVLKGPQGTLFGRSSTGGAVLFAPKRPSDEFDGYAEIAMGNFGARQITAAVNVPLVGDKLAIRVVGNYDYHDGYTRSYTTGQRLDDRNRVSIRIGVLAKPTDWLTNYTLYSDTTVNENGSVPVLRYYDANNALMNTSATGTGRFIVGLLCGADAACAAERIGRLDNLRAGLAAEYARVSNGDKKARRKVATGTIDRSDSRVQQIINNLTINLPDAGPFGDVTLKDVFAMNRVAHIARVTEQQGSPVPTGIASFGMDLINGQYVDTGLGKTDWGDQYSNEIQLGGNFAEKHSWIVGYFREQNKQDAFLNIPGTFRALNGAFAFPSGSPAISSNFVTGYKKVATGLFAQTTVDLADVGLDGVKFTGGFRHSKVKLRTTSNPTAITPDGFALVPGGVPIPARHNESENTYTLALDWKITSKVLAYATTRRGFKEGGINIVSVPLQQAGVPEAKPEYGPEIVTDYEIGMKSDWEIGSILGRTNLAVFQSDFKGLQRNENFFDTVNNTSAAQTGNIAESRIRGIELENTLQLTPELRVSASYAYLDAKYTSYPGTVVTADGRTVDLIDSPFTGAPKHKIDLTGTYTLPLSHDREALALTANYTYQSKIFMDDTEISNPLGVSTAQPGYGLINLRAEWSNVGGNPVDLSVFVRNLTDKYYIIGTAGILPLGTIAVLNGDPRTVGIQARIRFGASAN